MKQAGYIRSYWEEKEARRRKIENIVGFSFIASALIVLAIASWALVHLIEWAGSNQILGGW